MLLISFNVNKSNVFAGIFVMKELLSWMACAVPFRRKVNLAVPCSFVTGEKSFVVRLNQTVFLVPSAALDNALLCFQSSLTRW